MKQVMKFFECDTNGQGVHTAADESSLLVDSNIFSRHFDCVKPPKNGQFKNVKRNETLKVLSKTLTPKGCPFGVGLPMICMEKGVIAIVLKDRVAWLQDSSKS